MDIDEQLIEQNTETSEALKAGELRAQQREGLVENADEETKSIREMVQQKKTQEGVGNKMASLKLGASKPKVNPILEATDNLLKSSWENLISSWGFTLLWVDIHVFLNSIFGPSAFRDLGEEWVPDSIKKVGGGKVKQASSLMRIVEFWGCGCLNLGCLFLIIAQLAIVAMIVTAITNPFTAIYKIFDFGSLWHALVGGK